MPKNQTIFECSKCGAQSTGWQGRCVECGGWGTIKEQMTKSQIPMTKIGRTLVADVVSFGDIEGKDVERIKTGISEVDRVLGGGIVPGSLVLLGGEPGIGKSTLLLQLASRLNNCDSKNANAPECREDANEKIVEKKLSYKLNGLFFDVQKELGRFCREKQYGDVLEKKLNEAKLNFKREAPIEIAGIKSNFADFIIEDKILLELKTKNFIDKKDYYQTQRYLESANLQLGIIINFQQEHLKPKRVVNPKFLNNLSNNFEAFECNSRHSHRDILYNSGEESAQQIKMRFDRLGLNSNDIKYLGKTDIDIICATIREKKPALAIVDSIQTTTSREVDSSLGSIGQIRASTAKLMEIAKGTGIPIIIVGHITKGGEIAGPKMLEHMVDTVLYFEGEKLSHYRILRAQKNRFGNTNEIGIFEMTGLGLQEVSNPSAAFLEHKSEVSGSVLTCTLNGNRPFLVEIQALTNPTQFGNPMRKASGFDLNRLNIIATIINQRTDVKCAGHDIILNVAGGMKLQDPAVDLAVALAIISSVKNKILPKNLIAIGELGLGGEIRKVGQLEKRMEEAKRLGLDNILSPKKYKLLGDVINIMI